MSMTTPGFGDDWEEISVPRGSYVGWGDRPGQKAVGEVLDYSNDGGTDFDGKACPQLSLVLTELAHTHSKEAGWSKIEAGELAVINCGQASLKRAVQAANLGKGDLTMITFEKIENIKGGKTVKVFAIKVKRGSGTLSARAEEALAKSGAATDNGSAPADDPWGTAPAAVGAGPAFNDEPPF